MTVRAAFHIFDKDSSGALSTEELKAVLTRPGGGQPLTDAEVADIIKEFDLNGDVNNHTSSSNTRQLAPAYSSAHPSGTRRHNA